MSLVRFIATVSGFTLISRLLGFARDIIIAGMLGAGGMADAFFVAFKFPNLFRRLFGEGAFNAAFVPLLAGDIEKRGLDVAREFAARAMSMLILITGFLVAIIEITMPWAMHVFAPGFAEDPEKFALAVELSRITFPYLAFISAVALMSGVLNTLHRYAAAAGAPIILNICLIAALLGLTPMTETPAQALAWGVAIAGIAQFICLMIACKRAGFAIKWQLPKIDDRIKLLGKRIDPGHDRCRRLSVEPADRYHAGISCFGWCRILALLCRSRASITAWRHRDRDWHGPSADPVTPASGRGCQNRDV